MLVRLGWPSLEQHCEIVKATMMYKILHGTVAVSFTIRAPTRGHSQRFHQVAVATYECLSFPSTLKLWNSLPAESVVQVMNVVKFKRLIIIIS